MTAMKAVRIGAGAGFADDRIEPAVDLVERGELDYVVFECLAERTIALAQSDKLRDAEAGYNEWLEDRIAAVIGPAVRHRTRIITNMGAANPIAAARKITEIAADSGYPELLVAAVTGDDVIAVVADGDWQLLEREGSVNELGERLVSANAYLGAESLLQALASNAAVIVTGRVADPSLFLAPLIHEFRWPLDDWPLLGTGTAVGHLLECGSHLTGGYFADPGVKDVPDLASVGMPIAEVHEDGSFTVTKTPGSGGCVTLATVTEQLLYEVHDPSSYLTPDVTADFSGVQLIELAENVVAVSSITGGPRPSRLKVSVGYLDSFIGEGQISYAGPNALARGRLALEIVRQRLHDIGVQLEESRFELIGVNAVHRGAGVETAGEPAEVRVRVIGRTRELCEAKRIGHEVASLWLNGPAGGGGACRRADRDVAIVSTLIPRDLVDVETTYLRCGR